MTIVVRADAVRNERAILRATEELLTRHDPADISMERVAAAAGVGKGTVFHRFGSRAGLMHALMRERAHDLEVAVTTGPPPLGAGAPARARLLAFLAAMVELVARNKGLLRALGPLPAAELSSAVAEPRSAAAEPRSAAAEPRSAAAEPRDSHPVYRFWHGHIASLVRELRPDLDADMLAHVLLGALHSEPVLDTLASGGGARLDRTLRDIVISLIPE